MFIVDGRNWMSLGMPIPQHLEAFDYISVSVRSLQCVCRLGCVPSISKFLLNPFGTESGNRNDLQTKDQETN